MSPAPNVATILERVLAAAKERELAAPTLAAYRRTWLKLVAWTTAAGLDLGSLPREKAISYYDDLTANRSASHHLQVKAGIAFLYKVLDKKSPFIDCLAPRFRPEALEIHFLEAGDIGKVLLSMRNELGGDYFGRLASHLAEALFFTACRFHEWALMACATAPPICCSTNAAAISGNCRSCSGTGVWPLQPVTPTSTANA